MNGNFTHTFHVFIGDLQVITLTFGDFCTYDSNDYVRIYDYVDNYTSPLLGSLSGCGSLTLTSFVSSGPTILVQLITDSSLVNRGFIATFFTG